MSTVFAEDRRSAGIGTGAGAIMLRGLHIDGALLTGILAILAVGLAGLYSAVGQNPALLLSQGVRIAVALGAMLVMAQV